MRKRTLYVIDGHGQIYRCYYAPFRPLTAPSGEPTKATFVFLQMLLNLMRRREPDYLVVAMDTSDETVFRLEIDPEYKAHRPPPPEDLPPQVERIVQSLEAIGVPILRQVGYEADDLMATLCERFRGSDLDIVLVSRDKDLDQLLTDGVRLLDPLDDMELDASTLLERKGYRPDQAVDAQTLMGDSTDNVRGVEGVGPKKAAELLARYGTLESIFAHSSELTPKLRERIEAFRPRADKVRQLVTLRRDVPIRFELTSAAVSTFNLDALRPICRELGLNRLLEHLPSPQSARSTAVPDDVPHRSSTLFESDDRPERSSARVESSASPRTQAVLVDDEAALGELARRLSAVSAFAFDTETTSLSPVDADLVGISVSFEPGRGYYIPTLGSGRHLPIEAVRERLGPVFADARIRKCGQNCKYDIGVLRTAGMEVRGLDFDTMIASFVLDSSRRSHGIDALALDLLGYRKIATAELIGKGKSQITMDRLAPADVCKYAAEDADIALRLRGVLEPRLAGTPLDRLFREVELPLVEVLAELEHNGVALDTELLARLSNEMADESAALERQIHAAVGYPFNVDSTRQLAEALFDKLGLPSLKRTKTGRSTDAEVLEQLAASGHMVPRLVLAYRELAKLKGTYVDALPEVVSRRTGRVHPSFNQTVAVTGRLSCSDPNLQNIPIRTPAGARIRRAFVAGHPDRVLLKADYSQIELRVLAHFCGDEALERAFRADEDIHAFVAGQVFGVPIEQVSREQRARAKTVNFGIIYGQTAFGLARQTGMSRTEAADFIERYFLRYPRIRAFLDECIRKAREQGYVETILGRRRRIDDIASQNPTARAAAERFAVNTVIQGSAADLIKVAMLRIYRRLREKRSETRMLLQVHDELVFELPRGLVRDEAIEIAEAMVGALPLRVPVRVDVAAGSNWLDMEPIT